MKIANFIISIIDKVERNLASSNHEPQIKQKQDRHGNRYWQAYDFNTNKSYTFGSEQDVRVWIENRYHSF
ncbi:MAG: hypothetical protein AAFQ14_07000 [Cyanobacteria bacterium J06621_12]